MENAGYERSDSSCSSSLGATQGKPTFSIENAEKRDISRHQATKANLRAQKIVIVGRPNSGKSHVFSNLTHKYSPSANYPFTTLETKRAMVRINGLDYEIIDTPGMQGLLAHSEEELLGRELIFRERPDVIVQCADANCLKQALVLTAELLELEIPMVLCLNAVDETSRHGIWIDSGVLAASLGIPVVEMVAVTGIGTPELIKALGRAKRGILNLRYAQLIEDGLLDIINKFPESAAFQRKLAVLMLLRDPFIGVYIKEQYGELLTKKITHCAAIVSQRYQGNLSLHVINRRTAWLNGLYEKVVRRQKLSFGQFSQNVALWSRTPSTGLPIMAAILLTVFFAVVNIANRMAEWANTVFWLPLENFINSQVPAGPWNEFLIGHFGILTLGISNAFLTVLPILSVFFLLFNLLEDSGYITNLTVLMKRASARVGVTGNAILPITLAFGCKTMATLTTKSLCSNKEKFIAVYLIAFGIPCAAQMALNMSILGNLGLQALLITLSVLASVWILIGILLNKIIKDDQRCDFILELPPMRVPQLKPVLKKTYYKLAHFLEEALPIFISAAVILFISEKIGLLATIKQILEPVVVNFLGLPLIMVDALVLLLAKREAAAGMLFTMVQNGDLNYIQAIVVVTMTMMFVPCLTNMVAMAKEQGLKKAVYMVLAINLTAVCVAGLLNKSLLFLL
ncbi:MAG: ferrous iron transporter B [Desulfobulbaceae bacterium]|nr:ferrous iron transporter B [Desulfobulbaceae bacterium]HIJ79378.1 ferrous iron transporter B [Deltaproteobacteria bacterium]